MWLACLLACRGPVAADGAIDGASVDVVDGYFYDASATTGVSLWSVDDACERSATFMDTAANTGDDAELAAAWEEAYPGEVWQIFVSWYHDGAADPGEVPGTTYGTEDGIEGWGAGMATAAVYLWRGYNDKDVWFSDGGALVIDAYTAGEHLSGRWSSAFVDSGDDGAGDLEVRFELAHCDAVAL